MTKFAMECYSCRRTFTEPDTTDRCPECGGNNIATWGYDPKGVRLK